VAVKESESATFELPDLADAPAALDDAPPASAVRAAPVASDGSRPTALILGLGAAGLVGVGVGSAFGLMARSEYDASKEHCRPEDPNRCDAEGVDRRNTALTRGNVATVAFAVGGAALVGAGVLFLVTGPDDHDDASVAVGAELSPARSSVFVRGAF
jgi:serine/threonine-protein kinase